MKKTMNEKLIMFVDADPTITHLENMLQMADQLTYNEFLIGGWEADKTYYIDNRSHRNENGIYLVKPIAENERFFWYICPFCQQIHIESKRLLTHDKPVRMTNCPYRYMINQYVQFDCPADPLGLEDDVPDEVMQAEWNYMTAYLASQVNSKKAW